MIPSSLGTTFSLFQELEDIAWVLELIEALHLIYGKSPLILSTEAYLMRMVQEQQAQVVDSVTGLRQSTTFVSCLKYIRKIGRCLEDYPLAKIALQA